jgi:ornithine cyclodeaminase/alanine dehydrogenase-like protein (mu-crystallin family)
MAAWRQGMQMTVKIVNVFDGNLDINLPNHLALINLFDPNTGAASCIMDGTYITGIRTAASAVLSARMLSRTESRIATVIGAGVQGREHLRLLPLIRDFERINICSLRFDDARKLATRSKIAHASSDVEAVVRESDVVCLAAHSSSPVIRPEWIKPGTHVSSVAAGTWRSCSASDLALCRAAEPPRIDCLWPASVPSQSGSRGHPVTGVGQASRRCLLQFRAKSGGSHRGPSAAFSSFASTAVILDGTRYSLACRY